VDTDRIAHTAHPALSLLDEIRMETGEIIPLAWKLGRVTGICAIELYPAATLLAHNFNVPGYKRKDGNDARRVLLKNLKNFIELPVDVSLMEVNDDVIQLSVFWLAWIFCVVMYSNQWIVNSIRRRVEFG